MHVHVHVRRTAVSVALAATVALTGLTVTSSAAPAPTAPPVGNPVAPGVLAATAVAGTPVRFPRRPRGLRAPVAQPEGVEEPAGYAEQVSCNPVLMRGVRRLRDLAMDTYGRGSDGGVTRSCVSGGTSEHKEGRAWDWMLNVNNRGDRRAAGDFLGWLTAPGPDGRPGLKARRLGVMYVIYNRRIWASYRPQWVPYDGSSPHTDHIHLSFGWAGARGTTSFWTGRVARTDYGPCSMFRRQPAVISRRANPRPCGSPAALAKRSFRPTVLFGAADRTPVRVAQRRLGVRVGGGLDRRTWRAVRRYQRAHDLPVTGALDKPTWGSLGPSSVRWSVTEGYGPRRAARYAARRWSGVRLHRASAGRPVAFLQTALRLPTADRNGFVGRGTARALREFKAAHGMAGNANVNGRVWRALPARR